MDTSERAEIVISGDPENPELTVGGHPVEVPPGRDPMLVGIALVATVAERRAEPVPAVVIAEGGNWRWQVLVHADGTTTDDRPDTIAPVRRRPSRLAVAVIGVVLAGGGVTALAVTTSGTGRVAGLAEPAGSVPATTAPASVPASASPPPTSPPPLTTTIAPTPTPQPVAPAAAPKRAVPPPVAGVARTRRPAVTPGAPAPPPSPEPAPRRTPAPTPAGRVVAISDGAGRCVASSGSAVSVTSCAGSSAQKWTATAAGELRQGSRCLVTRSGVAVVDCASVPQAARTWRPTAPSPGLVNPATRLCLSATATTVASAQCGTGRSLRIA